MVSQQSAVTERFKPRQVGIITTTRADYGIYQPLLRALRDRGCRVTLYAGGTHPAPEFGQTIKQIEADGWGPVHRIEHHRPGDRDVDIAASCGRAVSAFAAALGEARPDLLFVLGDRFEMLAAGLAAVLLGIPLAHLHGGDVTEGANDDQFRHALTKLCHLHFAAIDEHAERIRAMGEEPWRVHAVGALAVDALREFKPEPLAVIAAEAGLEPRRATLVLAYHPQTLSAEAPVDAFERVASGIEGFDGNVLVVGTNADAGHA
ncbi:MAG: UDP-N-acetylglucosamine 2-epimerase, partial [Phycisphaerae bacterium]